MNEATRFLLINAIFAQIPPFLASFIAFFFFNIFTDWGQHMPMKSYDEWDGKKREKNARHFLILQLRAARTLFIQWFHATSDDGNTNEFKRVFGMRDRKCRMKSFFYEVFLNPPPPPYQAFFSVFVILSHRWKKNSNTISMKFNWSHATRTHQMQFEQHQRFKWLLVSSQGLWWTMIIMIDLRRRIYRLDWNENIATFFFYFHSDSMEGGGKSIRLFPSHSSLVYESNNSKWCHDDDTRDYAAWHFLHSTNTDDGSGEWEQKVKYQIFLGATRYSSHVQQSTPNISNVDGNQRVWISWQYEGQLCFSFLCLACVGGSNIEVLYVISSKFLYSLQNIGVWANAIRFWINPKIWFQFISDSCEGE